MVVNNNVCWGVPFKFNDAGRVSTVGGRYHETPTMGNVEAAVKLGVAQIVYTAPNERVMNGNFGVDIDSMVFLPIGHRPLSLLDYDIREQVQLWESRASVAGVSIVEIVDPHRSDLLLNLNLVYNDPAAGAALSVTFQV